MNEEVDLINKLKEIKKDELSEREFYEQVLSIIIEMRKSHKITNDNKEIFVKTLREIGCFSSQNEWDKAKEKAGEKIEKERPEILGIAYADIRIAVNIISIYLAHPCNPGTYILNPEVDKEWLENSINKRNAEKTGEIIVPKALQIPDLIYKDFPGIIGKADIEKMLEIKKKTGKDVAACWNDGHYINTKFGNSVEELYEKSTDAFCAISYGYGWKSDLKDNILKYEDNRDNRASIINKKIKTLFTREYLTGYRGYYRI